VKLARYTVTEPGNDASRRRGCTCPPGQTKAPYQLADDCPVHPLPHAFGDDTTFRRARTMEDHRDRERAARG